jgi:dipeptidyl aminopeptidase/acylaminoacyl peptidase
VHEYGGGAWTVSEGTLWFTEFSDQRLYRLDAGSDTPVAVTPEPAVRAGVRHADLHAVAGALLAVRETHAEGDRPVDVVNEIVRVTPDGTDVLVSGPDFVSDARLSPDGTTLAWLQWNHPDMPWDAAQLVVRTADGTETVVAGGRGESVVQPTWGEDLALWFFSDRTGFWSLYRTRPDEEPELVVDVGGDMAAPQWVFGQSRFALLADGRVAFAYGRDGADRLAVRAADGSIRELDLPFGVFRCLKAQGTRVVCVAGGPSSEPVVLRVDVDGGAPEILRPARDFALDAAWLSAPEHVTFPTEDRGSGIASAHALVYPPTNPGATAPEGDLPPLMVVVHGGPTANAVPVLNVEVQYWTSRGFCVADVDYRGSSGYGRRYRDALQGRWGVLDLDDVVACARFLADSGRVDPARMAIRGGSAGGYTTLAALSMRPGVFTAGASHYGVADLGALAAETHKFESRYLDGLVAPWPDGADVYAERSPINHVDSFDTPLAVFQGDEDAVVPPDQAEAIVAALAAKGVPHAYLLFAGEQHGFRKAANIRAALDGELSFYAQVWGFDLPSAEGIQPITLLPSGQPRDQEPYPS